MARTLAILRDTRPSASFLRMRAELGRLDPRARRNLALDLGAMHDAPRRVIERVAPMHGGAVVPQQEIADAPAMLIAQIRPLDMRPERIEQGVGFGGRKPFDIRIAAGAGGER